MHYELNMNFRNIEIVYMSVNIYVYIYFLVMENQIITKTKIYYSFLGFHLKFMHMLR